MRRAGLRDGLDVRRRGAAAAADHVDEASLREFADKARHIFRALVVLAEFVRQARVRIGTDQRIRHAADIGDMRAQVFRAERTVEADGERIGVLHRIPERFRHLARQQAARFVGDGAGNHHRHVDAARRGDLRDGIERSLGVQRVEDGFHKENVRAAVEQAVDLFAIGDAQIVEGHRAVTGVGDVRRDRCGAVGRAERAGDKARLAVFGFRAARRVADQARAFAVQFIGEVRHLVVGLRDGRGREGVCLDDVCARFEIGVVDVLDRLRLGQDQQVVVALDVAVKVLEARAAECRLVEFQPLDHCAHRAVEHENLFAGERAEFIGDGRCGAGGHERTRYYSLSPPGRGLG